jgi:hypothetical protein
MGLSKFLVKRGCNEEAGIFLLVGLKLETLGGGVLRKPRSLWV